MHHEDLLGGLRDSVGEQSPASIQQHLLFAAAVMYQAGGREQVTSRGLEEECESFAPAHTTLPVELTAQRPKLAAREATATPGAKARPGSLGDAAYLPRRETRAMVQARELAAASTSGNQTREPTEKAKRSVAAREEGSDGCTGRRKAAGNSRFAPNGAVAQRRAHHLLAHRHSRRSQRGRLE